MFFFPPPAARSHFARDQRGDEAQGACSTSSPEAGGAPGAPGAAAAAGSRSSTSAKPDSLSFSSGTNP